MKDPCFYSLTKHITSLLLQVAIKHNPNNIWKQQYKTLYAIPVLLKRNGKNTPALKFQSLGWLLLSFVVIPYIILYMPYTTHPYIVLYVPYIALHMPYIVLYMP